MTEMLDQFATWLAALPPSEMMRNSTALWPILETLHFIGLAMLVGVAGFFDMRLLGLFRRVPVEAVKQFMPFAMIGFAINLVTGVGFFMMYPAQYINSLAWWMKVLFLVIAGANALFFETVAARRLAVMQPGEDSPGVFKVIGTVSLVSWFLVLYFGRMLPFLGNAY
jgi:hypothetical protein